jgi:hypothetical protein
MSLRRCLDNRIWLVTDPGKHLGEQLGSTTMMTVLLSANAPLLCHYLARPRFRLLAPTAMASATDGSRHHPILDITTSITIITTLSIAAMLTSDFPNRR